MDRRLLAVRLMTSLRDRLCIVVRDGQVLWAVTLPGNERTELPETRAGWSLRLGGMPPEGIDVVFELRTQAAVRVLLLEEKTGVPTFPGVDTETAPGTMPSPGENDQGIPVDLTAICRAFAVTEAAPQNRSSGRKTP